MDEIGHSQVGKLHVSLATAHRAAGTNSFFVQDVGDLGIDVIVQELIDECDDIWLGLHLLRRGFWVHCRQGLGLTTLEAHMKSWSFPRREV